MDTRLKTLRITEFKGLNTSANPHNVDDAEFVEMTNVELSQNRTLESRKGFTKIVSDINAASVRALHKVDWDDYTSTLYAVRGIGFTKVNETAGTESTIGVIFSARQVQFQRWHDKLLILSEGLPGLYWMNSAETYKPAVYPQFKLQFPGPTCVAASAGGELKASAYYQYNISIVLGDNLRDGETPGALPSDDFVGQISPRDPRIYKIPGDYAVGATTDANRILASSGTNMTYSAQMNGFEPGAVRLFRRQVTKKDDYTGLDSPYSEDTPWVLLDTGHILKDSTTSTYSLRVSDNHVITAITGTYTSATDTLSLVLSFTDEGKVDFDAGYAPLLPGYVATPSAKYMARVGNRVFLGNILGSDPRDKKTVRFTYTGYLDTNATREEIPNFKYGFPMLAFGAYSWFYCDHEDTDDEITAMYGYRNTLMIFTGKCTFVWQEGMNDPIKISNDVGCVAQHTIREFEGRLIWLSQNGVMSYNGSTLKNLSADKVDSYINALSKDYAWRATAAIFNRRYYIAAPFTGGTNNAYVLVYDFDLDEWFHRTYRITESSDFYIDYFYKYSDGAKETLYAGGHVDATHSYIVKVDEGGDDGGALIQCSLKTKYYDFGAPDIIKRFRGFNIDIGNYAGSLVITMYLDNLNLAQYTHTHTGAASGFFINDTARGRLNVDSIINLTDEMFSFSLPEGKHASRCQYGITFTAGAAQAAIHALSFDWAVVRKLQRKYGGA